MFKVHAEIEYNNPGGAGVHSDICPPGCGTDFPEEYRQFLHECLDEWLDNSGGTGRFYIAQEGFVGFGID